VAVIGQAFVQVRPDTKSFEKEAGTRISAGLKRVAIVAAGFFAASGAKTFLKDSVQGYRDHNRVLAITSQVIKTTGGAANISAKQVGHLTDAIEAKTGVDGDAIQSGANLLLTFTNVRNEAGKGNQVFSRATGLLADMSVALGQSAKGSAIQLGKALNDPVKGVTALSRVGVSFDAQQKKAIKTAVDHGHALVAQKIILKELSKEFGGAAQAQMTSSDRQQVAFHALQDAVGKQLLPVMDKFHAVLADKVIPGLTDLVEKHGPQAAAFFTDLADKASGLADKAGPAVGRFFDKLKNVDTSKLKADVKQLFDELRQAGPQLQSAGDSLPSFNQGMKVAGTVVGFVADHIDLLKKALPFIIAGLVAYKAAQLANNVVGRNSAAGFVIQTVATFALAASHRTLARAIRQQVAASGESNAVGKISILTRIREGVATVATVIAQKAAAAASKAWAAAQWLLNVALDANPIGLVIVAIAALVAGIIIAYKKSETFRIIVQAVAKAVVGYFKLIANFWLLVVSGILAGLSTLLGALGHLPGKFGAPFRAAKAAVDSARGAVDHLRDSINSTKGKTVRVGVITPGMRQAISNLADLRYKIDHIPRAVTIGVTSKASVQNLAGKNALGTPYWRGGLTYVGEHGRELVDLPRGSRIHDANKTRAMTERYGATARAGLTINGDVYTTSPKAFFDQAKREQQKDDILNNPLF
jgi:hypothetical protein